MATTKPFRSSWRSRSADRDAVETEVGGRRRVEPELLLLPGHLDVIGVEQERRYAARALGRGIRPGEDEERRRVAAVRAPLLRSVDPPAVAVARRPSSAASRRPSQTPGSVSANAPMASPRASGGTKRAFCSSVPKVTIGRVAALVCTATVTPTPASARDSSSRTRT